MGQMKASAPRIGHIPSLDGLRAVSILFVFWAHASLPGGIRGGSGVTIFFFLSGYLITTLMRVEHDMRGRISLGDFYLRRVFRIVPPMYLAIGLGVLLTVLGLLTVEITAGGLAASGFFFVNYWKLTIDQGVPDGLGVLWSLAVEEHFYLVFPLVYIALRRFLPRKSHQAEVLLALLGLILAWRCYLYIDGASIARLYYATDTRIDSILYGALMAIAWNPLYGEVEGRLRRHLPVLAGAGVVTFLVISFGPMAANVTLGYSVQGVVLAPIFAYVILAPASAVGRLLNWRPVAYLGVLSYTIYLVHVPILHAVANTLGLPVWLGAVVSAGLAVAFAHVVHRLVERPMARLRKRISHVAQAKGTLVMARPES